MNKKYYLPAAASILIFAMIFASLTPAMAVVTSTKALPVLEVKTIAEDDQVRHTGVIVFGLPLTASLSAGLVKITNCADLNAKTGWGANPGPDKPCQDGTRKLAQYKILVTFNGVPVTPDTLFCQVFEKDKFSNGKSQVVPETVQTVVTDESSNFMCKPRFAKPGVGVLDLYYIGPQTKEFIADYGVVLTASKQIGRVTVFGSDLQDVCVLGWSMAENHRVIPKPSPSDPKGATDVHDTWNDALGPFAGCDEATVWQKDFLGFPITGGP